MKREFIVISNCEDGHKSIFDVEAGHAGTIVKYSELDRDWTSKCRGKPAVVLEDTGDGYILYYQDREIEIDYCLAEYMLIAFRTQNFVEDYKTQYAIKEFKNGSKG